MSEHRDILVSKSEFAVLVAWALTVLDALAPAYAVGGHGGLRDVRRMEWRGASGELRRR